MGATLKKAYQSQLCQLPAQGDATKMRLPLLQGPYSSLTQAGLRFREVNFSTCRMWHQSISLYQSGSLGSKVLGYRPIL